MRRFVIGSSLLALMVAAAAPAAAQVTWRGFVAGGASIASGDYETLDSAKTGVMLNAGAEMKMKGPLSLRFDALWGYHKTDILRAKGSSLYGLGARLVYFLPLSVSRINPYVLGGVGFVVDKYDWDAHYSGIREETKGQLTYGGGAGLDLQVGSMALFVEGRADIGAGSGDPTRTISVMPILLGVKWGTR